MNDDPKNKDLKKDKDDLVITPGGPRPKDMVHEVGPDEMIIYDEQGKARIVPRNDECKEES
jgi:hypothetical protein